MSGRVAVATVASGVALFVWGVLFWTVLPWSNTMMKPVPDEETVAGLLQEKLPGSGVYLIPWLDEAAMASEEQKAAAMEQMIQRHRRGPIVQIFFRREGAEPMAPAVMLKGLLIDLLIGLAAALLGVLTLPGQLSYFGRAAVVFLAGCIAFLVSYGLEWNFMYRPVDYTLINGAHILAGMLLTGLVTAAIIRPASRPDGKPQ